MNIFNVTFLVLRGTHYKTSAYLATNLKSIIIDTL